MKLYERKLLNQLLQGQELIIKRNGYCLFWYNKKADLNIDKLVEKAKEFINKKKIKICDRTIVKIWSDGEYNIKKEVLK